MIFGSQRTTRQGTENDKISKCLCKCGLNLATWITSDEEVKSQIPEADRPTKVVKISEAEPETF